GIGPVGTLVASGALEERDPLIVADFENRTADSTLGPSITEALRIDLGQSPIVKLVEISAIDQVLRRMNLEPGAVLDLSLASEIAQREGYKAVLTGEIAPLGTGYVLSARLVSAAAGETLVPLRETAESDAGIIGAVDRLSAKLRERIGESLRTIRRSESLERVTTSSVEALKKYTMANQISRLPGGDEQAVRLLEESIALDSTFAMAYRKLAAYLGNIGASNARQNAAASKAFELRDRLTPVERHLATAYYYGSVEYDRAKTISAYRDVLELDPENDAALNNLSLILKTTDRFEEAEQLALRAIETGPEWQFYTNAVASQIALEKFDEAHRTIDRFAAAVPGQPQILWLRARLASAEGDLAAADAYVDSLARDQRDSPAWRWRLSRTKALLAQAEGKIGDARHYLEQFMAASEQRGLRGSYIEGAARLAYLDVLFRANNERGPQVVDVALERRPLDSIEPADRPYPLLASLYADAGQVDRARELLEEFETEVPEAVRKGFPLRHYAAARIAIAEGRPDDAIAAIAKFQDEAAGRRVGWFDMAQAYELAGNQDSALVMYERAVSRPDFGQVRGDAYELPGAYKRLGELHEQRGDKTKAVEYYDKFVELWNDADAELQPQVKDVRDRIARLVGER
ncbi:MAG: tetratricopeptide repeat protein, partial [Gemmatimonadales bacterium]